MTEGARRRLGPGSRGFTLIEMLAVVAIMALVIGIALPNFVVAGIAILLVAGLATRKPWKRDRVSSRFDQRPLFVRFSTWLIATLFVPNVLYGVIVLSHGGESLDYAAAWLLGLLVSAIHGAFALADWLRRRARPGPPP